MFNEEDGKTTKNEVMLFNAPLSKSSTVAELKQLSA